ncbi:DUF1361 domain-containing protein, partial [Lactobacillus selangorensis]
MWLKFSLLLISTLFSTVIGIWGLDRVSKAISYRLKLNHLWFKHAIVVLLTILTSIGIFIGRFLRIHTIYLFL